MEPDVKPSPALPQLMPSVDESQGFFVEQQLTARCGVESRHTVLQQFCERSDVIMLDSDNELDHDCLAAANERRAGHHLSIVPSTGVQVVENCTFTNALPTRAGNNDHKWSRENGSKRRLFSSTNAKENMCKISGLLSPPGSSEKSPQWSFGSITNENCDHDSWKSEDLMSHQADHRGQDLVIDVGNAGELSMRLARLVNTDASIESTQSQLPAQPLSTAAAALNTKDAVEAKGIARSQQLRAKRKLHEADELQYAGTLSSSIAFPQNSSPSNILAHNITKAKEHQWDDMEELSVSETERKLDDAMELFREEKSPIEIAPSQPRRKHDKHKQCHVSRLNPYSRETADHYRSQSRHIEHDDEDAAFAQKILADNHKLEVVTAEEQKRRDERLTRMKVTASGGIWSPSSKSPKSVITSRSPAKFYSPVDRKPTSKHKGPLQRPQKQTRDAIRELMGTAALDEASNTNLDNNTDHDVDESNNPSYSNSSSRTVPTLSALEKFGAVTPGANRNIEDSSKVEDRYAQLPPQGEDLNLPNNIAKMSEDRQALIIKRETLKERFKDLGVIREAFKSFATLLAVEEPNEIHLKQLGELKKYTEAVLDWDRSGKSARKWMMDIRDNIRRRLQTLALDVNESAINVQLQDIIHPRYFEKLKEEMTTIPAELVSLKDKLEKYSRSQYKRAKKLSRTKTRARGDLQHSTAMSNLTKSERYHRSIEEKIEQRRAQIALFGKANASSEDFAELEIVDDGDDESVVSEEDAIDIHTNPLDHSESSVQSNQQDLPMEEIHRLENERQQKATAMKTVAVRSVQAADMSLLQRMAAKAEQAEHGASQGVQKHDYQILSKMHEKEAARAEQKRREEDATAAADAGEHDPGPEDDAIEVESSHEFDDSDLDEETEAEAEEEENEDGQPVCKRYIVKASITGISLQHDNDMHLIGRFLSRKKAVKKVLEIAPWMTEEYVRRNPDAQSPCSISLRDGQGVYEQCMTLGHSEEAACRTWIEEEMYNPSEEAYEKAKVYRACQPQEAWFVDWEGTIQPVVAEDEDDQDQEMQEAVEVEEQESARNISESTPPSDAVEQQEFTSASIDIVVEPSLGTLMISDTEEHQDSRIMHTNDVTASSTEPITTSDTEEHQDSTSPVTHASIGPSPSVLSKNSDDNDDLFGPDPSPESHPSALPNTPPTVTSEERPSSPAPSDKPEGLTVTRATGDHFRIFSSLALANRHAKDVFMRWFIDHLRGPGNLGYIQGEDESMEEQLKRIGDRAAWSRKEQFDVRGDDGVVRRDCFRVWVRKAKSSGPAN